MKFILLMNFFFCSFQKTLVMLEEAFYAEVTERNKFEFKRVYKERMGYEKQVENPHKNYSLLFIKASRNEEINKKWFHIEFVFANVEEKLV